MRLRRISLMSAVAITGATLGAGSSFAWFSEEDKNATTSQTIPLDVNNIQSVTPKDDLVKDGKTTNLPVTPTVRLLRTEETKDAQSGAQKLRVEIDQPAQFEIFRQHKQLSGAHSEIQATIHELEREAKVLREKGQPDAAVIYEKLAAKLKTQRQNSPGEDISKARHVIIFDASAAPEKGTGERAPRDPAIESLEQRMKALSAEIQALSAARHKMMITKPGPGLFTLGEHPPMVPHGEFRSSIQTFHPPGAFSHVLENLNRQVAELEKKGQKEQAQSIRQAIEVLEKDFAQRGGKNIRLFMDQQSIHSGPAQGPHAKHGPHHDSQARKSPQTSHMPGSNGIVPPVMVFMHELRHEIAELRQEVRDLKEMLKQGKTGKLNQKSEPQNRKAQKHEELKNEETDTSKADGKERAEIEQEEQSESAEDNETFRLNVEFETDRSQPDSDGTDEDLKAGEHDEKENEKQVEKED